MQSSTSKRYTKTAHVSKRVVIVVVKRYTGFFRDEIFVEETQIFHFSKECLVRSLSRYLAALKKTDKSLKIKIFREFL